MFDKNRRAGVSHLEISYELLYDSLPCDEAFDKDVGGAKIMRGDILFYERLGTRYG
jgi:hypothetical protein